MPWYRELSEKQKEALLVPIENWFSQDSSVTYASKRQVITNLRNL